MAETGVTRPLAIIILLVGVVLGQNDSPVLTIDLKDNQCCPFITVEGGRDAKRFQPQIFGTYIIEPTLLNGRVHYTALHGRNAIAFIGGDKKKWVIQAATNRGTTVGNVREVCTNIFDGSNQNAIQNACNTKACPNLVEEWQYWARYWDGLHLGPVIETEELWKDGGGDLRLTCSEPLQIMTMEQKEVVMSGNLTALKALVPSEVNVTALVTMTGPWDVRVPLLMAVLHDHKYTDEGHGTVQYLLEQGADPNVLGPMARTPIQLASYMSDLACIKTLEKAGADLNHLSPGNWSVLTFALREFRGDLAYIEPVVEYLLERTNIDPQVTDRQGATPLHFAAWWGSAKLVARLIEGGWDPTLKDEFGYNATEHATKNCPRQSRHRGRGLPPNCQEVKDMLDALEEDQDLVA